MSDISRIGGRNTPPTQGASVEKQAGAVERAAPQSAPAEAARPETHTTGLGPHGQPTGLPVPTAGQQKFMTDALAGRDPSQAAAAEQLRSTGGASATEDLLRLNRQPSIAGAIPPPPGNTEALRHMTPAMRRSIMRTLIQRQHGRMTRLMHLLRESEDGRRGGGGDRGGPADEVDEQPTAVEPAQAARARTDLARAREMLNLLEEFLAIQDYTFTQMGTYAQ
jgi:hypothetical protein